MPFIVAGHPAPDGLGDVLRGLEEGGADAVEIGIPFSDPIADGPVIAAAMHDSLEAGCTVNGVLASVAALRDSVGVPLIAMVSISIVDRLGGPAFVGRLAEAGFDGVILPDADLDATQPHRAMAADCDLAITSLIAPDTTPERAGRIATEARDFVYVLARAGITGERSEAPDLRKRAAAIREVTELPLVAGFGISTPEHVRAALLDAQGAIVGSALVRALVEGSAAGTPLRELARSILEPLAAAARPRD